MDKENVVVKVEQEEFVVVKEEQEEIFVVKEEIVDLTYENGYDVRKDRSIISLDSEPLLDVVSCPKMNGQKITDDHVKSSFIISKGVKSEVVRERSPSSEYDDIKKLEKGVMNPLSHFPYPVVPPFTLPYPHTMPLGMYPPSPYFPYPYHQLPMTPFPMPKYPHMLGYFHHPNNLLSSTSLPHLDVSEKLTTTTASSGHQGTYEAVMHQSVQRQDLMSNLNLDKRPLPPGKVKKKHLATSIPYSRTESKQMQVDFPLVTSNQDSDPSCVDVDGLDDTSTIDKCNFDPSYPFKCTHCGRGFARKYYLSVHMRIHTGVKSYRCSQCPKAYRYRNSLVIHQRNHHDDHLFECSLCDRKFSNKSDIKMHFKTHIPEKSGEIDYNELKQT